MTSTQFRGHGIEHVALDPLSILLFGALFAAVAYATYRHAWWAICAIVLTAPFALYRDLGPSEITLPKVTLLAVLAGLAAARAPAGNWGPAARLLLISAAAIALATALSVAQATYREPAFRETFKALQYLLTFAAVGVAMRRERYDIATRIAIVLTASLVAVGALLDLVLGPKSGLWFSGHPLPRLAGPLEGPNQLAGYLGIMLPLQCAFILLRRPIPLERQAFVLCSGVLVLTFSRSGILTVLISLVLVFIVSPSARKRTTVALLGAGLGAGVLAAGALSLGVLHNLDAYSRFASLAESDNGGGVGARPVLWHAAVTLWRNHPLLGIGAGNYELEIAQTGVTGIRTHSNSLYLQSLVEGGIPLIAAWVFTLGAAVWSFARGSMREPLIVGALAATVGLTLHQGLDFLVFFPKVGIMFWTMLAIGATAVDQNPREA